MQPSLSLAYAHRAGNGLLGEGFRLGGLSEIAPCGTDYKPASRVARSAAESSPGSFCLDGERLVVIRGIYGADGASYRTERESFTRVVSVACGSAPQPTSFRVYRKNGHIQTYDAIGKLPGHPMANACPTVRAWDPRPEWTSSCFERYLLTEERDRAGNAVHYAYALSPGGLVEYRPDHIDYTDQVTTGEPGQRRIDFVYEDRPDTELQGQYRPATLHVTKRLKGILAYAPAPFATGRVWQYALTYDTSPGSGVSRLVEVTRCSGQGGCLPATRFTWESSSGVSFTATGGLPWPDADTKFLRVMDVDHDGKADLLAEGPSGTIYLRSSGDPSHPLSGRRALEGEIAAVALRESKPVDIDGDGKVELLGLTATGAPGDGYSIYRWDDVHAGFSRDPGPPLVRTEAVFDANEAYDEPIAVADLDGDGLVDLLKAKRHRVDGYAGCDWQLYRSDRFQATTHPTTIGPAEPVSLDPHLSFQGGEWLCPIATADLSPWSLAIARRGEPRAALFASEVFRSASPDRLSNQVQRFAAGLHVTHDGSVEATISDTGIHTAVGYWPSARSAFGDFDGDGHLDLLAMAIDTPWPGINDVVYLRDASGSGVPDEAHGADRFGLAPERQRGTWQAADIDNDGRDELLIMDPGENTHGPPHPRLSIVNVRRTGPNTITSSVTDFPGIAPGVLGDFDGDGRLDIASWTPGNPFASFTVYRQTGQGTSDRITAVSDEGTLIPRERVTYSDQWAASVENPSCAYPASCMTHGLTVARTHVLAAGDQMTRTLAYNYEAPRYDVLHHRFLGFHVVNAWDTARAEETITTYENEDYRLAGLPTRIQRATPITAHPEGPSVPSSSLTWAIARIKRTDYAYRVDRRNNGRTFFPHLTGFVSQEWEDDVNVAWTPEAHLHVLNIEGRAPGNAFRDQSGSMTFDAFGDVLHATVSTVGGVTTEVTSTYDDDEDRWLIGRLHTRVYSSTSPGAAAPAVARHVEYAYDDLGALHEVFYEKDDPDPTLRETRTFYRDGDGQVRRIVDAAPGEPSRTTYIDYHPSERVFPYRVGDDLGHARFSLVHPAFGVPLLEEDENGVMLARSLDEHGRVRRVALDGAPTLTIDIRGRGTERGNQGIIVRTQDGLGGEREEERDVRGKLVAQWDRGFDGDWVGQRFTYDPAGHLIASTRPSAKPPRPETRFLYDTLDRLLEQTLPDGTRITYDHEFARTLVSDAKGQKSRVDRDVDGRVVKSTQWQDGVALTTTIVYGDFDQVTEVKGPQNTITHAAYDRRGRRTLASDLDTGVTTYVLNGFGEVTEKCTAGAVSRYRHDQAGRLDRIESPDGVTTFVFDTSPHGSGKLASSTSPDGITTRYDYDGFSRPIRETWEVSGEAFAFDRTYDEVGRLSTLAYPDVLGAAAPPFTVKQSYSPTSGALVEVGDASGSYRSLWHVDRRNAVGALLQGTYGNGIVSVRGYDDRTGRLTSLEEGAAVSLAYAYDENGMVTHRLDAPGKREEVFAHDELQRLTGWDLTDASGDLSVKRATQFTYDGLGNLRLVHEDGKLVEENTYAENAGPHALTTHLGAGSAAGSYGYDGRGRLTGMPDKGLSYNELDLPRTVTTGAGTTTFAYDASGARVKKLGPSGEVLTLGDGLYERRVDASGAHHLFRVPGNDGLVAEVRFDAAAPTGETLYLHQDPLGSVGVVTRQDGSVAERRFYAPFGGRVAPAVGGTSAPAREGGLGFAGLRQDDDLGLVDMRGRVYAPELRRFLTADPHVTAPLFGQSYNRYSYVLNNPLNLVDPSGYDPVGWWPSAAGCGYTGPPAGGVGYDAGAYVSTGGIGLFSQVGYFFHDIGTWFRDAFTPRASYAANVVKSDSQGLSLATGPTATATANLSMADKIGGFGVGVGIGLAQTMEQMALDGARSMLFGETLAVSRLSWVPGQVRASLAAGRGALGAAVDVLEGANERLNPVVGLLKGGLGSMEALKQGDYIGAGVAATPLVVMAATLGEGGAAAAEEGAAAAETGVEVSANTPVGRVGRGPMTVQTPGTNNAATIGGRQYSGHALDRMQQRGLVPSVIEDTIAHGSASPGRVAGTAAHYSATNNVTVIVDDLTGRVITTYPGQGKGF